MRKTVVLLDSPFRSFETVNGREVFYSRIGTTHHKRSDDSDVAAFRTLRAATMLRIPVFIPNFEEIACVTHVSQALY